NRQIARWLLKGSIEPLFTHEERFFVFLSKMIAHGQHYAAWLVGNALSFFDIEVQKPCNLARSQAKLNANCSHLRIHKPREHAMIVCVCNNVSDHKIRAAVDSGMTSMLELRTQLEVGTCCGKCHACAKTMLRECL